MISTISGSDREAAAERAVAALREGGLVVLPTDTVYAVVADAFDPGATRRLFAAKERGTEVPLSLLIRNPRQVIGLATEVGEPAERLMAAYWPGPLTILLPGQDEMPWELGDTGATVALRMPADDLVLAVAAEIGPLACSAACRQGQPPPTTAGEAAEQLGDAVDLYVDDGPRQAPTSTIVDCSRGGAFVLREGAVPTAHVQQVVAGDLGWGQRPAERDAAESLDDPQRDAAGDPAGG